jgi:hypothetical protein
MSGAIASHTVELGGLAAGQTPGVGCVQGVDAIVHAPASHSQRSRQSGRTESP